jgi:hypothetical protein
MSCAFYMCFTMQNNPNKMMAQAGVEHLSACFMLDQLLQCNPACKEMVRGRPLLG